MAIEEHAELVDAVDNLVLGQDMIARLHHPRWFREVTGEKQKR